MMAEWRVTKATPGRELTLNGFKFKILSGRAISILNPAPASRPSSSHGPRQTPNCSWIGEEGTESSTSINRNRLFFNKDTSVVLTRVPLDTMNLHVSGCELNSDGVNGCRRNSESFAYRLIRNQTTAPSSTCRQPTKVFRPGKRLPPTPRPAVSTAIDPPDSQGVKATGALICTKSTLSSPSTRQPLTFPKRINPSPGSSAGKGKEEPEQNLTDQPRTLRRMSSTSIAVPPSVTCLDFRNRGRPPPAEPYPFSDPFAGSNSAGFQKRTAELASLVSQTVTWEKRKPSKTSKLQTKSG